MNLADIFHYSIRSIYRQKSRNAFIIVIVAITSIFSLFTAGLFEGKNTQIKKNIIETETGHWQVLEKSYFYRQDPLRPASLTHQLTEDLKKYKVTPELILKTTILHPEGAQELTLIGIEPESHEKVFPLKDSVKGTWPLPYDTVKNVVVGQKFADKLKLSIGDDLIITYQDQNNAILSEALRVTGIFKKYGPGFEGHNAYVRGEVVRGLLNLQDANAFHRLILLPRADKSKLPGINEKNLIVKSWDKLHPELNVMMKFHDGTTRVLILFMLIIAFVSIVTPINILWEERKDEVKLLRTLGTGNRILYLLGGAEAMTVIFISLASAIIIWGILHLWSAKSGLDFTLLGEKTVVRGGILISPTVYPVVNWFYTTCILLFHALIILISNFWCIQKLVKREVLEG